MKTPVALIIFKRPETTERVFAEIARAKPPKLLVIANKAREDVAGEAERCEATRAIIERVDWDCEVVKNYSPVHRDVKAQFSNGLNWVFETVEEAIVLEDDCVPHQSFFTFCDELLERYRADERVMMISGLSHFGSWRPEQQSYHFAYCAGTWGWASWRRAWRFFDPAMKSWPEVLERNFLESFLANPRHSRAWKNLLQLTYEGRINTWDYQWYLDCWINHGLRIFPSVNLVSNIGFGAGATNTVNEASSLSNMPTAEMPFPLKHPPFMMADVEADNLFHEKFIISNADLLSRLKAKASRMLKRS